MAGRFPSVESELFVGVGVGSWKRASGLLGQVQEFSANNLFTYLAYLYSIYILSHISNHSRTYLPVILSLKTPFFRSWSSCPPDLPLANSLPRSRPIKLTVSFPSTPLNLLSKTQIITLPHRFPKHQFLTMTFSITSSLLNGLTPCHNYICFCRLYW